MTKTPTEPRTYTYGDMRTAPRGTFMLCRGQCRGEYSATRGDYFDAADSDVVYCCGVPAVLATRRTVTELVP